MHQISENPNNPDRILFIYSNRAVNIEKYPLIYCNISRMHSVPKGFLAEGLERSCWVNIMEKSPERSLYKRQFSQENDLENWMRKVSAT